MQPIVVIDGNNLAQIKYFLQGKPVTIKYDRLLIHALSAWAQRQKEACQVELFLDPRMQIPDSRQRVAVHVVERGEKADPHIMDFVRHCVMSRKPCVLITDDGALADYARQQGVGWIEVSEFVKSPNFLDLLPDDFARDAYPYLKAASPSSGLAEAEPGAVIRTNVNSTARPAQKPGRLAGQNMLDVHQRTYQAWRGGAEMALNEDVSQNQAGAPEPAPRQMVRLNLETWPLEDGYQFFTAVICPQHAREFHSLLGRPPAAGRADLLSYSQLVLELCSAEPDFYTRGASLMNRVRLELLQVYPSGLELAWLNEKYGMAPGFQHKLKLHSGKSIELYEITISGPDRPA